MLSERKTLLQKIRFLLSRKQKRELSILAILVVIGMLFEMGGLGLMIPVLRLMLNMDIGKEYPILEPYLNALGSPTQAQLVLGCMMVLVLFFAIKGLFLLYLTWEQTRFSQELSATLSRDLFVGYLKQPYAFHLQRNSAQLLRNIQTEVGMFTTVSQSIISLSTECSVALGVALMLVLVEPLGALIVTVFLGISSAAFYHLTRRKLLNWGNSRQIHSGLSNQHLLQGLGGVKDIKLAGRENHFLEKYAKHNLSVAKIQMRVTTVSLLPRIYLEFLAVVGLAALVILTVIQSQSLESLLPTLGVFAAAAFRMIPSVNRIICSVQSIRYARPVVDVLYHEFHLIRRSTERAISHVEMNFNQEIRVAGLGFCYPNGHALALDNVSLSIGKGECVGFIGPSGSGKSTLVDVILGLLPPSAGCVKVDGEDIRRNVRAWQDQIGYVPQSIYLTDDTLRRNVAFGIDDEHIDEEAVRRAIQSAQMDEFVATLPEGLDTLVGERGIRLSGGQRQRIGIARALYHDPAVLVLDEATSSLDATTEQGVMDAIRKLKRDKTILIVAHRLSTIEHCDRVYQLARGMLDGKEEQATRSVGGEAIFI